jgi:hypothetical protein
MVKIENGQLFLINRDGRLVCTKPFNVVEEINNYLQACHDVQKAVDIPKITGLSQLTDEHLKLLKEAIYLTLDDIIEEVGKIRQEVIDVKSLMVKAEAVP